MFDDDDTPSYLHDAYRAALDKGLLSLNLTRVGTDNRMWQASSRFVKSSGYHVEIEADALQAVMKALGAYARIGAPAPASPELCDDEGCPHHGTPHVCITRVEPRPHTLYTDADEHPPASVCDTHGTVVLGLCKVCGRGEIELELDGGVCPGPRHETAPTYPAEPSGFFDEPEDLRQARRDDRDETAGLFD